MSHTPASKDPLSPFFGMGTLRYYVDYHHRSAVTPQPGSVVYCKRADGRTHSGIYTHTGHIAHLTAGKAAESRVSLTTPDHFGDEPDSARHPPIYVSSNSRGGVGHAAVARHAAARAGERAFYGLTIHNSHDFSASCLQASDPSRTHVFPAQKTAEGHDPDLGGLKRAARDTLGVTKWRLWPAGSQRRECPPEPDWDAHIRYFKNLPLDAQGIARIRGELVAANQFLAEIGDEDIPEDIREELYRFRQELITINKGYIDAGDFLCTHFGAGFDHTDLQDLGEDFAELARQLEHNHAIRDLARRMGRDRASDPSSKRVRIPRSAPREVHGIHHGNDLMRLLPSELVNLEDDTLETLFHARLLEHNLLSYELNGATPVTQTNTDSNRKTGPIVACLDTSASMQGIPSLKAKASLLVMADTLKRERRSLHVLLFGASGQIQEFTRNEENDAPGLLQFLQRGYGGGTDLETPLARALRIIDRESDYLRADILMLSDGDTAPSNAFTHWFNQRTRSLHCTSYTVLCAGERAHPVFGDEVLVL